MNMAGPDKRATLPAAMPTLAWACKQNAEKMKHGQTSLAMAPNRGFSLLEVILAMGILAGAVVVLGELARMALRSAAMARDLSRAQLLCESKLSEITSGMTSPSSVQGTPCESQFDVTGPQWLYSLDVFSVDDQQGLLGVQVTVTQDLPPEQRPVTVSLTRWIPDPSADLSQTSSSDTSTTGSSGTGSSGSTSGSGP